MCGLMAFVGCSDPSPVKSCNSYCENLCESLAACDVEVEDCEASCKRDLDGRDCDREEAPDRLTCSQLTEAFACSQYCVALCDRAPSCGSFDAGACVNGCLEVEPSICNPASVDARSCDQLKPEIRFYEEVGADTGGSHTFATGPGPLFGLCAEADDCDEPLGCTLSTNTCGACETNDDCASAYDARVCNDAQECETVECLVDDDCILGGPCNTETHECGECRVDADCKTLLGGACDSELKCVECNEDADCNPDYYPSCDVAAHKCVD